MPNEDNKRERPKKDAGPTFAEQLFDVLARRRHMSGDSISKEELIDFWDEISDTSFESRLYLFFDMYVTPLPINFPQSLSSDRSIMLA